MLGTKAIIITPDILAKACEIDEFKGLWTGLETHSTGLNMLKEVAEFGGNFKKVLGPLKDQPLTPAMVRTLHSTLSRSAAPVPYKTEANQVRITKDEHTVGTLDTAPPEEVQDLLEKLVAWMNEKLANRDLHPLLAIAVFTSVFLQISPFEGDNLKTARFVVTVLLLKAGYSYAPYVPLDKIMNERAEIVFQALQVNQQSLESGRPDWATWMNCFLMILREQKNILKDRMFEKDKDLAHLPTLSAKVLKLFEHHNRLQMKQIVKLTKGRRSTLKLRLGEMVDEGYIRRYGNARATWYSLV
jgi:Fic family protein